MYRTFQIKDKLSNIDINDIKNNYESDPSIKNFYDKGLALFSNYKKASIDTLNKYLINSEELDGSAMIADWFPEIKADIFLSHSHADEPVAIFLAGLFQTIGLTTFIDSCIWGYSDDLLKKIDEKYSRSNIDDYRYDYNKRNKSTSHVHMMLNTALMNMIDKCECLFFLNSPNSIKLSGIKNQDKTFSPWIYSELSISKLIQKNIPERIKNRSVRMFEDGGKVLNKAITAEEYNISYNIDLAKHDVIDLKKWIKSLSDNISRDLVLDELYSLYPIGKPKENINPLYNNNGRR